jgi:hypothetical protein
MPTSPPAPTAPGDWRVDSFSSDTISYTYDELGRVLTRMLNSTGTEITYDALGRLSQLEFPIGTFDYTYVSQTGRRASVTYPNNQTTTYSYLDDDHDFRLQTIHHKNPSAATLSKFDYTYDTVGNILTWRQERAGSAATIYTFTHDLVDQLTSAVLTDTNTTPTILKRQAWAYDAAGNRTVDQTDDSVFATTHDAMNRLQSRAPGGPIVFAGSLNEAGTVTIDGKPATVDASNNFQGTARLASGTTTVTVKAKDASGNETTQQYEVDAGGSTSSYTFDANGNDQRWHEDAHWNANCGGREAGLNHAGDVAATARPIGESCRSDAPTTSHARDGSSGAGAWPTDAIRYYHGRASTSLWAQEQCGSDHLLLADHLAASCKKPKPMEMCLVSGYYATELDWRRGRARAAFTETGCGDWLVSKPCQIHTPGARLSGDPLTWAVNLHVYVSNSPTKMTDPWGLQGRERGQQRPGGQNNRFKGFRPDPDDPRFITGKDNQTGKQVRKPKTPEFVEEWNNKHPDDTTEIPRQSFRQANPHHAPLQSLR